MIDQFEFATGVVEDNNDPLNKARVRVRIDGYHTLVDETTGDTFGLVVEDLDWYPVLMPTTSSSRGGQGYSPSNLTRGDRVALLILDVEYKQSAIVIGTIHGDGDSSDLVIGGIDAIDSEVVENTNNSRSSAPNLNNEEYDKEGMEDDDVGYDVFFQSLVIEEGFVNKTYYDQFKYPHIGIGTLLKKEQYYSLNSAWKLVEERVGRKIPEKRITLDEAKKLATKDINRMKSEINKYPLLSMAYNKVSKTRQYALLSMCYQMGTYGVSKFTNTLNSIIQEDWVGAYKGMTNSGWSQQTPARAKRVASIMRDNNFNVYPTLNKSNAKSLSSMARNGISNISSDAVEYGDISDIQVQLMNSTKMLRSFGDVTSTDDLTIFLDIIINFDDYLDDLSSAMKSAKDLVNSVRDIDAIDFIKRYLDSFKKILEDYYKRIEDFIKSTVNKAVKDMEEIINLIGQIIKRIFFRIGDIGKDISSSIENVFDNFYEEKVTPITTSVLFTEPPSEYAGQYPHVKTEISESGHVREVDDTPGFERIREQHRTGTYREINSNGRLVEKTVSDRYLIVKKDEHIFIEGNGEITIGGNHVINIVGDIVQTVNGNVKQTIRGDSNVDIAGDSNITVHGNTDLEVKGNVNELIHGNVKTEIRGNVDLLVKGNVVSLIEGDVNETVNGNVVSLIKGNLNSTIEGTADLRITGNTEIAMYSDAYMWIEGNSTSYVGGDSTISVRGDLTTTVEGDWNNDVSGNLKFRVAGNIELYGNKIMLDRS